jgi:hypothetical protein
MHRPQRPRVRSNKTRNRAQLYRPHLEEIESRLLPGETVGLGVLASLHLFGGMPPFLASPDAKSSIPAGVFRSTEAAGDTQAAFIHLTSEFDQSRPVALSASRNSQADQPRLSAIDPPFAGSALTDALANEALDPWNPFATPRPSIHQAAAAADVSSHPPDSGFALVPLLGSSLSSSSGTAPAESGPVHAAVANPGLASVGVSGAGAFLQHGRTVVHQVNGPSWSSYAHDPQHTAISDVPSQPLMAIHWQTPVDLNPPYNGGNLLIHYGSPLVTQANTVIVPVKTGANDGFEVEAFDGGTGSLKWTVSTDYSVPKNYWTPPMSLVLTPANRLYIPGAGGTVYTIDNPDANNATISGQQAFYGLSNYDPSFDDNVKISTPLTSDSAGNLYFGFIAYAPTTLNLRSGIARMDPSGNGSWVAASTAAGDSAIAGVVFNCAPALSNDQNNLYIAVSSGSFSTGYLLRLDSTTLATTGEVFLGDPNTGFGALLPDAGTASPTVGPDGDVYFGVLESPFPSNNDRGWLLHFSGDLAQTKIPGAFGWDDTASIVPASMVPSYSGSSAYLMMTKYNNYKEFAGDGVNRLAVLDPNAMMPDPITGATVMQEVLTIAGVTPDPELPKVREWCINTAAIDPATKSILANSEDGALYRWDMVTNSFTQSVSLTIPTSEAYTPTVIGVDGTVYAVNNSTLFAVGQASG